MKKRTIGRILFSVLVLFFAKVALAQGTPATSQDIKMEKAKAYKVIVQETDGRFDVSVDAENPQLLEVSENLSRLNSDKIELQLKTLNSNLDKIAKSTSKSWWDRILNSPILLAFLSAGLAGLTAMILAKDQMQKQAAKDVITLKREYNDKAEERNREHLMQMSDIARERKKLEEIFEHDRELQRKNQEYTSLQAALKNGKIVASLKRALAFHFEMANKNAHLTKSLLDNIENNKNLSKLRHQLGRIELKLHEKGIHDRLDKYGMVLENNENGIFEASSLYTITREIIDFEKDQLRLKIDQYLEEENIQKIDKSENKRQRDKLEKEIGEFFVGAQASLDELIKVNEKTLTFF